MLGDRWIARVFTADNGSHGNDVAVILTDESLPGAPADEPIQVWSWLDESADLVRARMFAPSEGKPEDEACGSTSMVLAVALGRDLTVVHGQGSVIHARPRGAGVDLGGRCVVLD